MVNWCMELDTVNERVSDESQFLVVRLVMRKLKQGTIGYESWDIEAQLCIAYSDGVSLIVIGTSPEWEA